MNLFKKKVAVNYYFDKYGNCFLGEYECATRNGVCFETIATSKKKANKDFNKWVKTIR